MVCCFTEGARRQRANDAIDRESHLALVAADVRPGGIVVDAGQAAQLPLDHVDISASLTIYE